MASIHNQPCSGTASGIESSAITPAATVGEQQARVHADERSDDPNRDTVQHDAAGAVEPAC
jgi:hypothetical protein